MKCMIWFQFLSVSLQSRTAQQQIKLTGRGHWDIIVSFCNSTSSIQKAFEFSAVLFGQPWASQIDSYEKITTVTHKQLFIEVHVHAQKCPWTNNWQPLDCGLIIRWSCFKLPLYFPIILDVTHKLFWLLSVVNINFVLFPTSFDTHSFKCWLPQYL